MEIVSIRGKLIASVSKLLIFSIGLFLITELISSIFQYRANVAVMTKDAERDLVSTGQLLVKNNSIALRGLVSDNAFSAVRELVSSTVKSDESVVYGIYMDENLQPWVFANKENPEGTITEMKSLNDKSSLWASKVDSASVKKNIEGKIPVYEFAAPVIFDEERSGTIRYGISTGKMNALIEKIRDSARDRVQKFLALVIFMGVIIFFLARTMMANESDKITKPLLELSKSAGNIADGDYDTEIKVTSDDEVALLANNFETMRQTVRDYTLNLEQKVEERTKQIKDMQQEMVEKAHKAGMADIATGTLHNVGNILTSVKTSTQILNEIAIKPQFKNLVEANGLLRNNMDDLDTFFSESGKGKKLMQYYLMLEDGFIEENEKTIQHIKRLAEKIDVIADVISAQQSYAGEGGLLEEYRLDAIIEDSLTMLVGTLDRHHIEIVKEFEDIGTVPVQKVKLVHILINLFNNAKDAMVDMPDDERRIIIKLEKVDSHAYIKVKDTGHGIKASDLEKIFSHGYTTKDKGHGFGLHSSANYMVEMGGRLRAESEGDGKGATFILDFPLT